MTAVFQRAGRNFYYSAKFEDIDTGFRAGSGFIPRVGDVEVQGTVGYNWYAQPGAELERVGIEFKSNNFFDHDGFWGGEGPYEWEGGSVAQPDIPGPADRPYDHPTGWLRHSARRVRGLRSPDRAG